MRRSSEVGITNQPVENEDLRQSHSSAVAQKQAAGDTAGLPPFDAVGIGDGSVVRR